MNNETWSHIPSQWLKFTTWTKILLCTQLPDIASQVKLWKTTIKPTCYHANMLSWWLDISKTELCFRCHMPVAVNVISMTLIQQPDQEKLLILKTKTHSFHTANVSYRHISSKPQFFIIRQTRTLS